MNTEPIEMEENRRELSLAEADTNVSSLYPPVPWVGQQVRTSGALNPGVPALGATCFFLEEQRCGAGFRAMRYGTGGSGHPRHTFLKSGLFFYYSPIKTIILVFFVQRLQQ